MIRALPATGLALLALTVTPAGAAAAGWTSPQAVQPGEDPVLSFSPSGAVAVGSTETSRGHVSGTEVDVATNGTSFAASPYTLKTGAAGQSLVSLAFSSDGYLAAGFARQSAPAPVLAQVAKPAPSRFAKPQQLFAAGTAADGQASPDQLALIATSAGEVVGAGMDDGGALYTASLPAKATSFSVARGPGGLSATDDFGLATDASGNSFLAGDGPNGCTAVAFRAPEGKFVRSYVTGNCASATPNVFDAITATGSGQAAMLTEDVSEAGTSVSRLLVQTGRDGRFGAATQLGGALGGDHVGLASDADGQITASWTGCVAGPVVNGVLSTTDCAIDAASGTMSHGFSTKAAGGTTIATATSGALSALTADRAVAVSACQGSSCSFTVSTTTASGSFRSAHRLGTGKQLIALESDAHGNLLAVWTNSSSQLYAATGSAATGSWSAAHRLSSGAVTPSTVTARYGPKQRAIVAWSSGTETYVASYG